MSTEYGVPYPKLKSQRAVGESAAGMCPELLLEVIGLHVARKNTADDKFPQDSEEMASAQLEVTT